MVTFKLNSQMKWDTQSPVPHDAIVWLLIEQDTCDPTQLPCILRVHHDKYAPYGKKFRLLDYDPETQDEYLHTSRYSIMAWRHMTETGDTWKDVDYLANWVLASDEPEEPVDNEIYSPEIPVHMVPWDGTKEGPPEDWDRDRKVLHRGDKEDGPFYGSVNTDSPTYWRWEEDPECNDIDIVAYHSTKPR